MTEKMQKIEPYNSLLKTSLGKIYPKSMGTYIFLACFGPPEQFKEKNCPIELNL